MAMVFSTPALPQRSSFPKKDWGEQLTQFAGLLEIPE